MLFCCNYFKSVYGKYGWSRVCVCGAESVGEMIGKRGQTSATTERILHKDLNNVMPDAS